jgi:hypothetical protein
VLFSEVIAVHSENHTKHIHVLSGKNADSFLFYVCLHVLLCDKERIVEARQRVRLIWSV